MARQPSDQDKLDFASLTDAIIPSNIYLNSWSQTDLPRSSDGHPSPFGYNMLTPAFGNIFPLADTTGNSLPLPEKFTPNHTAFNTNSFQHYDADTSDQDKGVGNALNARAQTDFYQIESTGTSTGQQTQAGASSSTSQVQESNIRAASAKDPLANLKLRAKESVMAKRARSVRSASNDSKSGRINVLGADLPQTAGSNDVIHVEELDSQRCVSNAAVHASSVQSSLPLVATHNGSAKASSLELEDLIAEGKAAASLPKTKTKTEKIRPATQQHQRHGDLQQVGPGDVSEVGEIRDPSSGHEQEAMNHQATLSTEHFAADEIDEIDLWLAMTGYYDKSYRDKILTRRRRLQEIEEERLRLLEEEQEDQRLRGHAHTATPFRASQRPNPLAVAIRPLPSTPNQDLGLRIKDFAVKKIITPEDVKSNDNVPLKRVIGDETTDTDTSHQAKVARTEVHRRTPPRSHLATPQTRHRSASPVRNKKQLERPPRSQSPHSRDVYDRWQPDREADHRDARDRSPEEHAGENDSRGRYDQRRDSGFSTSHPAKQDVQDGPVRFFLLKSWNYENIATAQREGTWATQTKNEDTFVEAFKTCSHVIFFFSANHSKAFQGYARMQGLPGERGVNQPSWVKNLHWPTTAPFKLRWIVKEETPYRAVGNLKNPLNENLAIFVGRDGQEIPEKLGHQLCDIIDEDTSYRADLRR